MFDSNRRGFLANSAAAAAVPLLPDLGFLAPLSGAAAADTRIDPDQVRPRPSIGLLIKLIRTTPRDKCVPVFIEQLQAGLSYQDLLSALLLATIEHGDPHQVLGVYSATASAAKRTSKNGCSPCSGPWTASSADFRTAMLSPSGGSRVSCREPTRRPRCSGKPWTS